MFPEFNIYSTPLLFLVLQGLIFAILLLAKFGKTKFMPHLILALILLITCWHRITYTIGFMGWYDTYKNTKINYYLIPLGLALAPFLFFYVKSITTNQFKFSKKNLIHFFPIGIYVLYRAIILIYDSNQSDYAETQNGVLMTTLHGKYVDTIVTIFSLIQMTLYLAFTFQVFYSYKKKINQFYSNTYKLELKWLRNFLIIYTFLFAYSLIEMIINEFITPLHWTQFWWYHFFSGLAIIYIGIQGYYTETEKLLDVEFDSFNTINNSEKSTPKQYETDIQKVNAFMNEKKPFLNPNISLSLLSKELEYSPNYLSEVINNGFQKNFNDFINSSRVEAVKQAILKGKHKDMSLVGIALDCGFNSKPTFNRVFKKLSGLSPSEFIKLQLP